MAVFIIYIVYSLFFASLIAWNITLRIMKKSNTSGTSKGDFYRNTKQPMRIHVFSLSEYYHDMQENPEHYNVIQL